MKPSLAEFENQEFARLKRELNDLAARFPGAMIETDESGSVIADPHLMAFIMANARLIAGARHQFETEWSDLTARALESVAPHYASIIPPMAIAQLTPDGSRPFTVVPKQSMLRPIVKNGRKGDGTEDCMFRVAYETGVLPIEVTETRYQTSVPRRRELSYRKPPSNGSQRERSARTSLQIEIAPLGPEWRAETLQHMHRLRLHIACSDDSLCYQFHEAVFQHQTATCFKSASGSQWLAGGSTPVGLRNSELLLPIGRTVPSRQHFLEYFCFPRKFLFVDFLPPTDVLKTLKGDEALKILILFDSDLPELDRVSERDLLFNCTPIVNLFETVAQSIRVEAGQMEYPVIVDPRKSEHVEVYSVDQVKEAHADKEETIECPRQYGGTYRYGPNRARYAWNATRPDAEFGNGVHLELWDAAFDPRQNQANTRLDLRVTCCNRDLASTIGPGQSLQLESGDPMTAHTLTRPTATLRPPGPREIEHHLRLHLAEPRLSLLNDNAASARLQAQLQAYSVEGWRTDAAFTKTEVRQRIARRTLAGIARLRSRTSPSGLQRINIELDESALRFNRAWLFAALLRRFLVGGSAIGQRPRIIVKDSTKVLRPWQVRAARKNATRPKLEGIENVALGAQRT